MTFVKIKSMLLKTTSIVAVQLGVLAIVSAPVKASKDLFEFLLEKKGHSTQEAQQISKQILNQSANSSRFDTSYIADHTRVTNTVKVVAPLAITEQKALPKPSVVPMASSSNRMYVTELTESPVIPAVKTVAPQKASPKPSVVPMASSNNRMYVTEPAVISTDSNGNTKSTTNHFDDKGQLISQVTKTTLADGNQINPFDEETFFNGFMSSYMLSGSHVGSHISSSSYSHTSSSSYSYTSSSNNVNNSTWNSNNANNSIRNSNNVFNSNNNINNKPFNPYNSEWK